MPSPVPQSSTPRSRFAVGHPLRERMRVVGVVGRLGAVGAEVLDRRSPSSRERALELFLQLEAGVVGGDEDSVGI